MKKLMKSTRFSGTARRQKKKAGDKNPPDPESVSSLPVTRRS